MCLKTKHLTCSTLFCDESNINYYYIDLIDLSTSFIIASLASGKYDHSMTNGAFTEAIDLKRPLLNHIEYNEARSVRCGIMATVCDWELQTCYYFGGICKCRRESLSGKRLLDLNRTFAQLLCYTQMYEYTHECRQQPGHPLRRPNLIGIGIPIIKLTRSSDRLRFLMEIYIPVIRHLYSE